MNELQVIDNSIKHFDRMTIASHLNLSKGGLSKIINQLKEDGRLNSFQMETVALDGKKRQIEYFDRRSFLTIAMRVRNEVGYKIQDWLLDLGEREIEQLEQMRKDSEMKANAYKLRASRIERLLDKEDREDLYPN